LRNFAKFTITNILNEYYNYALWLKSKRYLSSSLGRKEIELAEAEMPGLMALRSEYKTSNHLLALLDVCT
jgi:hypothetical protein